VGSVLSLILLVGALSLSSCSAQSSPKEEPTFFGPWAVEIQRAYQKASDPTIREILRDGEVSAAEMEEIRQKQISCLAQLGVEVYELNPDGSGSVRAPQAPGESVDVIQQRASDLQMQCDRETGWSDISYLYHEMMRNPDNRDTASLMAECLTRMGLVPDGYTGQDYMSDFSGDTFLPYLEHQETPDALKFRACDEDPVHAQP
jgi:hypothetical protein